MIVGALLLVLIGSADFVRAARRPATRRAPSVAVIALVWAAAVLLASTGLGLAWWWSLAAVALALLWLWSTSANPDARATTGVLPAVGVLVALLAALLGGAGGEAAGYLVTWHDGVAVARIRDLPIGTLALALGVVLFLVESANIVVRAALRPAVEESAAATAVAAAVTPTPVRARWWRRPQPVPVPAAVADLRGGRLIGPLERLLIVALTLAGALPIVAGVLAAKGIVRFPEISTDGARGSKAEYFLVGSLVSWSIAIVATGALWISAQG
ncbi:MAG: hypothetical protein Q7T71_19160 [Herbiconiux sp.]|nr:hypothetical protein [Herbiconiux sp.]